MKLNTKVAEALNQQINSELGASYAYLAMAAYFDSCELPALQAGFGCTLQRRMNMPCGFMTSLSNEMHGLF